MKFLIIPTISLLLMSSAATANDSTSQSLKNLVDNYTARGLPGMVLSLKGAGLDEHFASGFANLESRELMQPQHKLMVASITKMFMSVLALKLAEQGRLSLDQPITSLKCGHLFRKIKHANKITITHLLNHTSGLPDFIKHPAFFLNVLDKPYCNWRQRDLVKFLQRQKPLFAPGEKAAYSNSNFLLLTIIIDNEFASGENHLSLLSQHILQPLQMHNTVYTDIKRVPELTANGYAELYNDGNVINMSKFNTGGSGNGYSGMYSTAADLQKLVHALFIERSLLSDSSMEKMMEFIPDAEEPGVLFGLGIWQEFRQQATGHRGRDIAFTADVWWIPSKKISVVVLANCGVVMDTELGRTYQSFRKELFELLLR